ncbi:PREDICTED: pro-FMRFamide-related neuropeptide VF [Chrysochloris asiatica]|uniref:Pro-FMRFamide-related neuropeptide VF n=1 Tax=Chrysochloris asiatica TaxID=185453 RepID=A0A9B0T4U4_CHRAS|nr:PREDICTED: pro-FMRFamide-related neuropeptide VF [Chrysochloris asiatica]
MEIISSKRFILLTLATSSLFTTNVFSGGDFTISNLHSKENYNKYSESTGDPKREKERSLNFEELKDWGPKNIIKMSTLAVNKMPHSVTNLPLRFGRTMEAQSPRPMAILPLRFGRNMRGSILRRVPNLPQRFGRTTAKSVTRTLSGLIQQSMDSPSVSELLYSLSCQPQEIQNPDQTHPRSLGTEMRKIRNLKPTPEDDRKL